MGAGAKDVLSWRGKLVMKELADSFAQLIAIIMITLALAVSTAAISQWASAEVSNDTGAGGGAAAQTPALLVAGATQ